MCNDVLFQQCLVQILAEHKTKTSTLNLHVASILVLVHNHFENVEF